MPGENARALMRRSFRLFFSPSSCLDVRSPSSRQRWTPPSRQAHRLALALRSGSVCGGGTATVSGGCHRPHTGCEWFALGRHSAGRRRRAAGRRASHGRLHDDAKHWRDSDGRREDLQHKGLAAALLVGARGRERHRGARHGRPWPRRHPSDEAGRHPPSAHSAAAWIRRRARRLPGAASSRLHCGRIPLSQAAHTGSRPLLAPPAGQHRRQSRSSVAAACASGRV